MGYLTRVAVTLLLLVIPASAEPLDIERFLSALRMVETGNHVRDGAHGERGPWQVTAAVWSMHMPETSFAEARQEGVARACAAKHVALLCSQLRESGCDDNAFNIALAWNAGLARTLAGRAPLSSYDHALRVWNLYLGPDGQNAEMRPEPAAGTRILAFAK